MEKIPGPGITPEEQLESMVENYQGLLLRMCYVYLQDVEMARDAVQETFFKAYRFLPSFRHECSEKTWLIRIAMNTCRSLQRSSWLRHMDRHITPDQLPLSENGMPSEDDLALTCAIMSLPTKWKEIIMLYYWHEMNVREIADYLRISQSTVSNRLKKAREKLREMLDRSDMI